MTYKVYNETSVKPVVNLGGGENPMHSFDKRIFDSINIITLMSYSFDSSIWL